MPSSNTPSTFPSFARNSSDDVLVEHGHFRGVRGVDRSSHVPPSPVNRNLDMSQIAMCMRKQRISRYRWPAGVLGKHVIGPPNTAKSYSGCSHGQLRV